ncbi:calcium-dependent lipid-binding protein isoform X1 [Nicotiana sylvestris]|uniref:Synaptotagmin-4 isoform X1 n=1 Tax=Nicotiana sylvestris TaxID=4096 RepID=A0A1U7WCP8_NICSY|nr:PREDICTED: synaptotagmin-4 isoform X1 [Nicotiana sylvestris]XP_009776433.1 PREDICTED: synaptotagmin-4 isoform X1 [Nicotiana sylvestris]XP_009776434.1 PREDICTED: synaptotagmin-4 isoform X1 [Nicotiana sylvestris]XP_009776435.1 PREDICTED: synaptotagmin-4 isoform X1 [Nicotiana sylvestris]
MGLISGILMGMILGIGLMAAWKHMMRYRSNKRVAKAVDVKLMGCLNRDDLKKVCGDNFPEWISFPVYEQVKWLNKQLSKLWPFIAEAGEAIIRESVEPLLEDYRPPGITSLKFSKLSLGTVAPKIEAFLSIKLHLERKDRLFSWSFHAATSPPHCAGIRVQSLKKGQITMDIDLRWGGDPNIVLGVEAAMVASIPIQLKNLQVFTVIRVIFQLTEEIPCISAVVVALLSEPKPRIDYVLKAVGGSLTALPGLSDMIDDTVNTIVTDMLEWPHRIVVPIGGVPVDNSDLELKPQGKLIVTVVKANGLKNHEMIGKSDPYVVVYIRPLFKVKTKTIDNNLNPVWDQTFELIAEDKETQSLIVEVFDKDVGQDQRMGVAKLPLNELVAETAKEIELRLLPKLDMLKVKDKKDRGTITIKVLYHEFNKEEQLAALEAEKVILEERKKLKAEGVIGSTMDALDGAASLVGSGVGLVGTGLGAGVGLVGTGVGAGVGIVGSGFGAVGSGLSKAGKFMGRTFTSSSKKSGSSTPVNSVQENGGAKPLKTVLANTD